MKKAVVKKTLGKPRARLDARLGIRIARKNDCPLCAKYRDKVTGYLIPNAETIAAIEEGRAMMRGEIPSKLYHSFEELWADLEADDEDD